MELLDLLMDGFQDKLMAGRRYPGDTLGKLTLKAVDPAVLPVELAVG